MGITFEILPMAPGDSPEAAIARSFEGGMTIGWEQTDDGWEASATGLAESDAPKWTPPEDWRDTYLERIAALHDWQRDDEPPHVYFWDPDVRIQVEFDRDGVTLRRRGGVRDHSHGPSDAEILRAFSDLPAIVHNADDGWWITLDDVADDMRLF